MRAANLVKRGPVVITVGRPLMEAVGLMARENVGSVVIVDDLGSMRAVGIVTERDVIRALANGVPLDTPVERVGTVGDRLIKAKVYDTVGKVASLMISNKIRHVVIVDEVDRVVGVVSVRDILGDVEALREIVRLERYPRTRE